MSCNSEDFINNIIHNRFCEVEDEVLENNEKYAEAEKEYSELFHQIGDFLPEGHKELIYRFDKVIGLQINIVGEALYKQGFKDGIQLKKIIG